MKKVPLAFLVHNSSLSGMSYSMIHIALYIVYPGLQIYIIGRQ